MKYTVFLVIALLALTTFANSQKKKYVGYKHKGVLFEESLPNGVKHFGGGLLTDTKYGVSRYVKGKKEMLWLEKVTGRDNQGVPAWQVKDVLVFDKLSENEELMFAYASTCKQNGRENLNLIVKTELAADGRSYKVLDAWKTDLKREKIVKTSIANIQCEVSAE